MGDNSGSELAARDPGDAGASGTEEEYQPGDTIKRATTAVNAGEVTTKQEPE